MNIPGEVASVVTTLDGYQMAQQGRAGPALAIAAITSFVAGTLVKAPLPRALRCWCSRPAIFLTPPIALVLMAAGLILTTLTLVSRPRRSPA